MASRDTACSASTCGWCDKFVLCSQTAAIFVGQATRPGRNHRTLHLGVQWPTKHHTGLEPGSRSGGSRSTGATLHGTATGGILSGFRQPALDGSRSIQPGRGHQASGAIPDTDAHIAATPRRRSQRDRSAHRVGCERPAVAGVHYPTPAADSFQHVRGPLIEELPPYQGAVISWRPPTACNVASMFNNGTPASTTAGVAVTLGMQFQSSVAGFVTAIRFYKQVLDTGTHIGSLWDSTGRLLGQVTFANESATGWQIAQLSAPVAIQAATNYVISYFCPTGKFNFTSAYFQGSTVHSGPLSVASAGGLFSNGNVFPTTASFLAYFADLIFDACSPGIGYTQPSWLESRRKSHARPIQMGSSAHDGFRLRWPH